MNFKKHFFWLFSACNFTALPKVCNAGKFIFIEMRTKDLEKMFQKGFFFFHYKILNIEKIVSSWLISQEFVKLLCTFFEKLPEKYLTNQNEISQEMVKFCVFFQSKNMRFQSD